MSDSVPPKSRRVTAADVARSSGVSRATVSYVLNNVASQTIPKATRERVRAAAAELGYAPSAAAASLRRGHSRIVLVITEPALSGGVTEPFLLAIAEHLVEAGYTPVTHQMVSEDALLGLVDEVRPFGVLALVALSAGTIAQIESTGVPRVYSSAHGDPAFPRPWEEEIGAIQARRLIDAGCRTLAYAAPPHSNPREILSRSRAIGVARVCTDRGLPAPLHLVIPPDLTAAVGELAALRGHVGRVGICAFDDSVAAIALAAARTLGVTVPDELAVIGVDDAPFSPFLAPPLTTLAIDGRRTGLSLAERFLGSPDTASTTISRAGATIIERGSV
jgi:DNA-binding LacI/PurR family transcriptional regulator